MTLKLTSLRLPDRRRGRKVAAAAGKSQKVNLELGGIDPFIVCEDASSRSPCPGGLGPLAQRRPSLHFA